MVLVCLRRPQRCPGLRRFGLKSLLNQILFLSILLDLHYLGQHQFTRDEGSTQRILARKAVIPCPGGCDELSTFLFSIILEICFLHAQDQLSSGECLGSRAFALLPVGCVLVCLTVWLRPGSIFNRDLWISLRDTLLWGKERELLRWMFIQIPSVRECLRSDSWEVEPEVGIRECCCHALMEKPKTDAGEQDREEVAKKGFGPW